MMAANNIGTRWSRANELWLDLGGFLRTNALDSHLLRTVEIVGGIEGISRVCVFRATKGGDWVELGGTSRPDADTAAALTAAHRARTGQRAVRDGVCVRALPVGEGVVLLAELEANQSVVERELERLAAEIAEVTRLFDAEFRTHRGRRDLENRLREQARELRRLLRRRRAPVGQHASMQTLISAASRVATSTLPVLIIGETGTGKEVLARFVHQMSKRPKPMVVVDCGAIPASLLESELFGAERGAFTGATTRTGRFEEADGGTLLLDEIGELPLELQPKLLRVLQNSKIRRVGGTRDIELDLRIIAATHRDLREMVDAGTFREDLFFRLRVAELSVPPLRSRGDDVILLANHFIRQYCVEVEREFIVLSERAQHKLMEHDWPGNVRELKNALRSAILTGQGPEIDAADIRLETPRQKNKPKTEPGRSRTRRVAEQPPARPSRKPHPPLEVADWFWSTWVELPPEHRGSPWAPLEGYLLRAALARAGGSLADAAELVGLTPDSFGRHLGKLGSNSSARALSKLPLGVALQQALGSDGLLDRVRAQLLTELLVFCRGNKSEMARALGWGRGTLARELVRLSVIAPTND